MNRRYYVPRRKSELIDAIKPSWNGTVTALRQMGIVRLKAIFRTMRERQLHALRMGSGRVYMGEEEARGIV